MRIRYPTARPIAIPPITLTKNRVVALPGEKLPVTTAATAKRYATSAVPSLTRLSPSITAIRRRGRPRRCAIAVAAVGSVGETIAPSTNEVGRLVRHVVETVRAFG